LGSAWPSVSAASPLLSWAKDARRGQAVDDPTWAAALDRAGASPGPASRRLRLLPSPYTDYNHAGLLYFASFVSLADTAEHLLLSPGGALADLAPGIGPWCQRVSPIARDVLYYRNLPCGEPVEAELVSLDERRDRVTTHMRLWRASDGARLADVLATKVKR
jgi:probable biosynthetic protein (TIGR04098 family)